MLVNSFHKMGVFSCLFCCQLIKKASLVNLHQIPPVIPVIPVSSLLYSGGHFQKKSAICNFGCPSSYSYPCYGGSLTYLEDHPSQYVIRKTPIYTSKWTNHHHGYEPDLRPLWHPTSSKYPQPRSTPPSTTTRPW